MREELFNARRDKTAARIRCHPVPTDEAAERLHQRKSDTQAQQLLFVCRQLEREHRLWAAYTTNGRVKIKLAEDHAPRSIDAISQIEEFAGQQWVRDLLESPDPKKRRCDARHPSRSRRRRQ